MKGIQITSNLILTNIYNRFNVDFSKKQTIALFLLLGASQKAQKNEFNLYWSGLFFAGTKIQKIGGSLKPLTA